MEWDLPAGPMCRPMLTLTLACHTRCGRGGVAEEVVGVAVGGAAEVAVSAGAGWHPTGTRGGRTTN